MPLMVSDKALGLHPPCLDRADHLFRGTHRKKVVLYFLPRDDTPGRTKEACGFRDTHAAFAA